MINIWELSTEDLEKLDEENQKERSEIRKSGIRKLDDEKYYETTTDPSCYNCIYLDEEKDSCKMKSNYFFSFNNEECESWESVYKPSDE